MIRKRSLKLGLETRRLWVRQERERGNNLPLRPQLTPPVIQKDQAENTRDLRLGENSK